MGIKKFRYSDYEVRDETERGFKCPICGHLNEPMEHW